MTLLETLKSAPLTRSVPEALENGHVVADIYTTAVDMGYTRAAVSHALRRHGIRQRKPKAPRVPRTKRVARAPRTPRAERRGR